MATQAETTDVPAESKGAPAQLDPTAGIADPGPLGLGAFALTTFVLSVFNAGLLPKSLEAVVLPLALFYGGLAQLLAGQWEFRKANTFGAVAFTSYGAFWLSFAAYVKFIADGLGSNAGQATGLYLLVWGIFTAYMTIAALRVNISVLSIFVALTLTFLVLAAGSFTGATTIAHLGGVIGLVTALLAWYGSAAGVVNSTWKRTVLPVGPLAPTS
jgi:succinate-acetate transporter protein